MALPIAVIQQAVANGARYLPALAARLGVPAKAGEVLNFAKKNPTTFMLAAKETYDQGVSLFDSMFSSDPVAVQQAVKDMVMSDADRARLEPADLVKPDTLDNIDQLEDEMLAIQSAIYAVGSFDNLMAIRRVLSMNNEHFETYLKLQRFGRVLR